MVKIFKNPENERLNNLNDPVLNVLRLFMKTAGRYTEKRRYICMAVPSTPKPQKL